MREWEQINSRDSVLPAGQEHNFTSSKYLTTTDILLFSETRWSLDMRTGRVLVLTGTKEKLWMKECNSKENGLWITIIITNKPFVICLVYFNRELTRTHSSDNKTDGDRRTSGLCLHDTVDTSTVLYCVSTVFYCRRTLQQHLNQTSTNWILITVSMKY